MHDERFEATDPTDSRGRALLHAPVAVRLGLVVAAGVVAWIATGGLDFPLHSDEPSFWRTTLWFAERMPPTIDDLRGYQELMTPLAFVGWGALEAASGAGPQLARASCLAMALGIAAIVAGGRGDSRRTATVATVGLLLCPYFLYLGTLLYTDVPATLFAIAGLEFDRRRRNGAAAIAFVLAIATRQYMVAFPAALLVHAAMSRIWGRDFGGWPRIVVLGGSAATLLVWQAVLGGVAPAASVEKWATPQLETSWLNPSAALYFLASIGAWFVIPEWLLRGCPRPALPSAWRSVAIVALIGLGYAWWPPYDARGLMVTIADNLGIEGAARDVALCGLSILAVGRIAQPGASRRLAPVLVAVHAVMMCKAWIGADKYALPVISALWLCVARGGLPLWRAGADAQPDVLAEARMRETAATDA